MRLRIPYRVRVAYNKLLDWMKWPLLKVEYDFISRLEKQHLISLFRFYFPHVLTALKEILDLFSGAWERRNKGKLLAFGPYDFAFRGWYAKLAHDFQSNGRFGYAWDDGLGMALGTRSYNNWATYALLKHLGMRRMCALGYLLMILSISVCAAMLLGPLWAPLFGILAAISPRIIISYTHMGKPEMFWWPFVALAIALLFAGHTVLAALLWSILALCNLPCAIILIFYGAILALTQAVLQGQFLLFILALIPGVIKIAFRLFYMWRSGYMKTIAAQQYGLVRFPKWFSLPERRQLLFFVAAMLCAAFSAHSILPVVVCLNALAVYWVNYRVIYFNDDQVMALSMILLSLITCLWAGSILGLVLVFFRAFPLFSELELSWKYPRTEPWEEFEQLLASHFPCFLPLAENAAELQPLRSFFAALPDKCRVVTEYDAAPYATCLRPLLDWTDHSLPSRKVDVINEIYTCFHNQELIEKVLASFSADRLSPPELMTFMRQMGASVFMAFSESVVEKLRQAGFTLLAQQDLKTCPEVSLLLREPCDRLYALAAPTEVSGGNVPVFRLTGSALRWAGRQGESYLIPYNFNPNFIATQGNLRLVVEEYRPFASTDTRFMRIVAQEDGEIVLWFRPFPNFFPDWFCEFLSTRK